jgi:hypothetical protein
LHVIADITTRWNSSFLAWQRLLRLKDYINLLINTLSTKTDLDSKKDCKRLKKIMLKEEEWNAIKDLVQILKPFAEATNYLGGSKYCTYSIMIPTLIRIINRLQPSTTEDEKYASEIDFKNHENIFDDEIFIEDDDEEENPSLTTIKKLKINDPVNTQDLVKKIKLSLYAAMKYYWRNLITPKSLLPSLLDPRIKDLSFVTAKQRQDTEELLEDEYDQEKLSELLLLLVQFKKMMMILKNMILFLQVLKHQLRKKLTKYLIILLLKKLILKAIHLSGGTDKKKIFQY